MHEILHDFLFWGLGFTGFRVELKYVKLAESWNISYVATALCSRVAGPAPGPQLA